jgi:hypothetical protein
MTATVARACPLVVLLAAAIPAAAEDPLADGLYRVERAGTRRVEVAPVQQGERLLIHDRRYYPADPAGDPPAQLVVVGVEPDVALDLAEPPRPAREGEGPFTLVLRLAEEPASGLAELTTAEPRVRLALVVDGEIVTVLRANAPVTDGVIAIAGCRESACDHLADQLRDNVVQPRRAP